MKLRAISSRLRQLMGDEERRYVLKHSLSGLTVRVAGLVLMTIVTMLFTRLMGAEDYGRVAFLLSSSFIVVLLAGLGLPTASLRLIPRYLMRQRRDLVGHYLVVSVLVTIAMAVLGGLALALVLTTVPSLAREYGFNFWSVVALVVAVALMRFASETSRACGLQLVGFAGESVVVRVLLLAALGLYLWSGTALGANAAVVLWVTAQAAVAAWVAVLVFRRMKPDGSALRRRPARLYRGWLGISTVMLVTPVYYFLLYETDAVMLGILAGPEEVGIYNVTRRLAELVVFGAAVASSVGLPKLAEAHASRQTPRVQTTIDTINAISLASTGAIVLCLVALGPWLLRLFGPEFAAGYVPMLILALARLGSLLFGPASDLLLMTGHHARLGKVNLVCAVVNIVLNLILIPPFGVIGAASATALALTGWSAWLYLLAHRHTPIETSLLRRAPALLIAARAQG